MMSEEQPRAPGGVERGPRVHVKPRTVAKT